RGSRRHFYNAQPSRSTPVNRQKWLENRANEPIRCWRCLPVIGTSHVLKSALFSDERIEGGEQNETAPALCRGEGAKRSGVRRAYSRRAVPRGRVSRAVRAGDRGESSASR